MSTFDFQLLAFSNFTPFELYAYLQLRSEVFVVEQTCIYQDLDDKDQDSLHVLVFLEKRLVACARIVPAGICHEQISIGRVIVAKPFRQKALGQQLMTFCIEQIENNFGPQAIALSAQAHLQDFYKKLNFAPVGEIYLEDDIPHILMIKS
ncbi:MAG: GNAT family N-acetyltransferase [Flavobacteriales bacterium]